jgi:hypothetical protein
MRPGADTVERVRRIRSSSPQKTKERAEHPLEYVGEDGALIPLYAEAEAILKKVPRYGLSIVCQKSGKLFGDGSRLAQDVNEFAGKNGFAGFMIDKARHGGMTNWRRWASRKDWDAPCRSTARAALIEAMPRTLRSASWRRRSAGWGG